MPSENRNTVRIHKFLSDCGVCSRRQAEDWIREGLVKVNGSPARIGQTIDPARDAVSARGRLVSGAQGERLTLVMNKPRGVLCTNSDPEGGRTVFDLLPLEYRKRRLYCAGRLDKDSEGLLILTNDGALAQKITHPSGGVVKKYRVEVNRAIDPKILEKFLTGVVSEGEVLRARKVEPAVSGPNADRRVDIYLEQGRKREIRRMFEAFGYFVKTLKRVQMGTFVLRKLGLGCVRRVSQKEIAMLTRPALPVDAVSAPAPAFSRRAFRPTQRSLRYEAQKRAARLARESDTRPFSARALREAKEGDNVLLRVAKKAAFRAQQAPESPAKSAGDSRRSRNAKGAPRARAGNPRARSRRAPRAERETPCPRAFARYAKRKGARSRF